MPRGGRDRGVPKGTTPSGSSGIFIRDLPSKSRKSDIRETFERYGGVLDVDIVDGTGNGYVDFSTPKVVDRIMKLVNENTNFLVLGKRVQVTALNKRVRDKLKLARVDREARREENERRNPFPKHLSARSRSRRIRRSPGPPQRRGRQRSRSPLGCSRKVLAPAVGRADGRPRIADGRSRIADGRPRIVLRSRSRGVAEEPLAAKEAARLPALAKTKNTAIQRQAGDLPKGCKNIYVKPLSPYTSDEDLTGHFRKFGHITGTMIRESLFLGFRYGVVSFSNAADANKAFREVTKINGESIELSPDQEELKKMGLDKKALGWTSTPNDGPRKQLPEKRLSEIGYARRVGRKDSPRRREDSLNRGRSKRDRQEESEQRRDSKPKLQTDPKSRKVFIKSLPATVDSQRLRMLMEQFGEVETSEAVPHRAQGFVVFVHDKDVQRVVAMERLRVDGVDITIDRYIQKPVVTLAAPKATSPPRKMKFRTQPTETTLTKKIEPKRPVPFPLIAPEPKRAAVKPEPKRAAVKPDLHNQIQPPDRDLIDYLTDRQKRDWYKVNNRERQQMKIKAKKRKMMEKPIPTISGAPEHGQQSLDSGESGEESAESVGEDQDEEKEEEADPEDSEGLPEEEDEVLPDDDEETEYSDYGEEKQVQEKDKEDEEVCFWEEDDTGYDDLCLPDKTKEKVVDPPEEEDEDDGSWDL